MVEVEIKRVGESNRELPKYATAGSAGFDLCASISKPIVIAPGQRCLIPAGISIALPVGYEAQVRPRSGLALKHGITVLNSPGTIDSDYRGEIGVILINHSDVDFTVNDGDRICQMVVAKYETVSWREVNELSETERGDGGFGHTGI